MDVSALLRAARTRPLAVHAHARSAAPARAPPHSHHARVPRTRRAVQQPALRTLACTPTSHKCAFSAPRCPRGRARTAAQRPQWARRSRAGRWPRRRHGRGLAARDARRAASSCAQRRHHRCSRCLARTSFLTRDTVIVFFDFLVFSWRTFVGCSARYRRRYIDYVL